MIKQVQKRHAGIYQCFASNAVSVTYGSAMLQVSPKQVTAQGNSGDLAEIEDPELFDGNICNVFCLPILTWNKFNGNYVMFFGITMGSSSKDGDGILAI